MRFITLLLSILVSVCATAQQERDTVLRKCPLYITDTTSSNNFFIEGLPATLKVYRTKGDLTIAIQQRDQFFTMFFGEKKLRTGKYKIKLNPNNKEVSAKYSFRSGDQVSYVNVVKGEIECTFDKEKDMWRLKVSGTITNLVERAITYYRVRADLFIK